MTGTFAGTWSMMGHDLVTHRKMQSLPRRLRHHRRPLGAKTLPLTESYWREGSIYESGRTIFPSARVHEGMRRARASYAARTSMGGGAYDRGWRHVRPWVAARTTIGGPRRVVPPGAYGPMTRHVRRLYPARTMVRPGRYGDPAACTVMGGGETHDRGGECEERRGVHGLRGPGRGGHTCRVMRSFMPGRGSRHRGVGTDRVHR
jgi:hypothetical protein